MAHLSVWSATYPIARPGRRAAGSGSVIPHRALGGNPGAQSIGESKERPVIGLLRGRSVVRTSRGTVKRCSFVGQFSGCG